MVNGAGVASFVLVEVVVVRDLAADGPGRRIIRRYWGRIIS